MELNHRRGEPCRPLYREDLHRRLVLRSPLSYLLIEIVLEVSARVELACADLQSTASPLGQPTMS